MNGSAHAGPPMGDEDARRLVWIVPIAVVLWASMLTLFGVLLQRTAAPPPELAPVEARIIEMPPEPAPASIAPGPPAAKHVEAAPQPKIEVPKPVVVQRPHPHPHPRIRVHHERMVPPPPPTSEGIAKSPPEEAPETSAPATESPTSSEAAPSNNAAGNASSTGGGAGLGSDHGGARALFAPTPTIPDDLRDEPLQAVAVAHFTVGIDGSVQVSLIQPTENPELNEVLLETLKKWRFAPAMKHGIAIASQFDVRIPVVIQ